MTKLRLLALVVSVISTIAGTYIISSWEKNELRTLNIDYEKPEPPPPPPPKVDPSVKHYDYNPNASEVVVSARKKLFNPGLRAAFFFGCMILGMLCFQIFIKIQALEAEGINDVDYWNLLKTSFRGTKFAMALIVSPIVFLSIYSFSGIEDSASTYILAFQNGFFWITVFNKADSSTNTGPARTKLRK